MARSKGSANLAASLEVLAGAPLDARQKVPLKSDLTASGTFPYFYEGMQVYVAEDQKIYCLIGADPTVLSNWKEVGSGSSGGSDNVIEGYRNPTDGLFYEESTYTTAITGAANTLYIDLSTNDIYRWDGTNFIIENTRSFEMAMADYSALPEATKKNGAVYFVPDATAASGITVFGNRFDKANIYTDTERMIGSYMGKPLYQKTIDVGTLNSGETTIVHNISNFEKMVGCFGRCSYGSNGNFLPIPYVSLNSAYNIDVGNINTTSVGFNVGSSFSSINNVVVTLQYTKTGDGTVNVGSENDYSTDEMIIGTWTNGKPLYQKTFLVTSGANSSPKTVANIGSDAQAVNMFGGTLVGHVSINYAGTSSWYTKCYINAAGDVILEVAGYYSQNVTITVQYTKTTD